MVSIAGSVDAFEQHMQNMDDISSHMASPAETMPVVQGNMDDISGAVRLIDADMGVLGNGMTSIEQRFGHMTGSVAIIRENVRQISGPMGLMNPIMP